MTDPGRIAILVLVVATVIVALLPPGQSALAVFIVGYGIGLGMALKHVLAPSKPAPKGTALLALGVFGPIGVYFAAFRLVAVFW